MDSTPPIFKDEALLDGHVEFICHQLHTGAIAHEKKSKWGIEFGTPFVLKVKAEQSTEARPATFYEKLDFLEEFLRKSKRLLDAAFRISSVTADKCFCLETLEATEVFIPALTAESIADRDTLDQIPAEEWGSPASERMRRDLNKRRRDEKLRAARQTLSGFTGLTVWLAKRDRLANSRDDRSEYLLLLISSAYRDASYRGAALSNTSAHKLLRALYEEAQSELKNTIIYPRLVEIEREQFPQAFARDPVSTLRSLNARTYEPTKIKTFYVVRRTIPFDAGGGGSIIGYPIFIGADPQIG